MTAIQVWLLVFIVGVAVFMLGVLAPRREAQVLGAAIALVGAIGWTIQALSS